MLEGERGIPALRQVILAHPSQCSPCNALTKNRAEVSGTGKKAFRQRVQVWPVVAIVALPSCVEEVLLGPKPRDYSQQINQKTRRLALQRALYEQANNGAIDLIEDWVVART